MEDTNEIAFFHYQTEQNIRALSLYGGNIKIHLTLPPSWPTTTQHLREIFLKRAAFLEESGLHEYIEKSLEETGAGSGQVRKTVRKPSHGYGRFFAKLYLAFYEGKSTAAEAISLPTFQTLLNDHLNQANIHPHPQTEQPEEQRPLPELPELPEGQGQIQGEGKGEDQGPDTHEIAIRKSLIVLDHLANLFIGNPWHSEIMNLRSLGTVHPSETGKTLIGLIGTPDAAQSSVVNAIVGANILPETDSAGLGITTTVSYNSWQEVQYYAEIDFLTGDEWATELRLLLADIADVVDSEDEVSSEAARAMDKLCAVYACSEAVILGSTAESLLQQHQFHGFLDQNISLQTDDLRVFTTALEIYRPPLPAPAGKPDKGKYPMRAPEAQRWPLVREIRLFTKAEALATGTTLVSLPTAHDSNRARVAIAERYMRQLDVHWIVVPVTRAVDECVARDLVGDMRLQLHLDGGFGDLVFICTETASPEMCEKKETCISLKKTIRELKRSSPESVDAIQEAQEQKKALEVEIDNEKANAKSESVSRHKDTRNALRHDYTQGLHDFYNSIKTDELLMLQAGGWDHRDQDVGDHTEHFQSLGMKLPVFCVNTDFPSQSQEDIKLLQSFCVRATDGAQWQSGVRFLMHVRKLLTAIALWASAGYVAVTDEEKQEIEEKFRQSLDMLEDDVESSRSTFTKGVVQSLKDNVLTKFSATTGLVCELDMWDGIACGLPLNTYQAICRRNGVLGLHNWNQELANLAIRPLVPGWKDVFEVDIPLELEWFAKSVKTQVYGFHQCIVSFIDDGTNNSHDSQLWLTLYNAMKHEMNRLTSELRSLHRELNREFAIGVEQAMLTTYTEGNIHAYSAYYIFNKALEHVRKHILQFMHGIERRLSLLLDALVQQTSRHYRNCMVTPILRPFTLDQLRLKNDAAGVVRTAQRELELDLVLEDELSWEDARERHYQDVLTQRQHHNQQTQPRRRTHGKARRPLRLMGRIQEV